MTGPSLETLAAHLLVCIEQRRYDEARPALERYCATLGETLAALPPADPLRLKCRDDWRQLSEQIRRRLLCARAHTAVRLARLSDSASHTWSA